MDLKGLIKVWSRRPGLNGEPLQGHEFLTVCVKLWLDLWLPFCEHSNVVLSVTRERFCFAPLVGKGSGSRLLSDYLFVVAIPLGPTPTIALPIISGAVSDPSPLIVNLDT